MRKLITALILLIAVGCQDIPIAIDSVPQGATVILEGRNFGETPTTATVPSNFFTGGPSNARLLLKKEGYVSHSSTITPTYIGNGAVYWPDEKTVRLVPKKD